MPPGLVAGVDSSTQATKVLVVDPSDGTIVAAARAGHTVTGADGARETDPRQWRTALATALAQSGRAGDIAAISVAGQQHGLVTLDAAGEPVRPAILWNDTRAAGAAARLTAAMGGTAAWADVVGVVPVASFTAAKWAWLRLVEPEAAAATRSIRLPHDYLTELRCGRGVTDRGDASGTAWWSTRDEAYADDVLSLPGVDLDPTLLPEILGPREAAGEVGAGAAAEFGLPAGAAVGPGTGDNMGAALGLGLEPGTPVLSLGTSGTAYAASTTRAADATGVVAGFADATGGFLPLAATLNCTLAVDRIAGWLGLDRENVADGTNVVVMPYLDGERTPNLPNAAGTITGLRHTTGAPEILLAAYEGAAVSLLETLDAIDANSSGLRPAAPLLLIGGGAQGTTWQSVVARLCGRPLQIPAAVELVALGAAAQAAATLTGESPAAVAGRWRTREGTEVEAMPRDEAALARIRRVREAAADLNA